MRELVGLTAIMMGLGTMVASANPPKNRLTSIDLADCKVMASAPAKTVWKCQGLPGYAVFILKSNGRYAVSYGQPDGRSSTQAPGQRNTIFDGRQRPTIEWRIVRKGEGKIDPFATIVRFHQLIGGKQRELLVITKIGPAISCVAAIVDASARSDAMAVARHWADTNVRDRPCPSAPQIIAAH